MPYYRLPIVTCFVFCCISLNSFSQQLFREPLGIQAYTFRRSLPFNTAATLDTIRSMGIRLLEGGAPRGMTPEAFRKLCEEKGIRIPSTGASYEELVNRTDSVVYKARALGASYVMCSWIPHSRGAFSLADAQKAVADFNRAGQRLQENGLTLCYHVHGYEFQPYGNGTLLDYLVMQTNPDYVSFEMDILWVQFGGGDPVTLLNRYGNRWKLMHLKDLRKGVAKDLTGGTSQENDMALGTGELDIPGILKAAKKAGIRYYFIEDESSAILTQVPQTIRYLKSLKK
ncbi:sugar phosphate isomerase/epimerase family protein [Sediminibacterium soli]|uniref:sugar phosphate isomerase/epimerase family protein n=1 Tax=Sediminibacterium soli TaxID=2698829 RepID=UPI001379939A|nr:TIM barrel protein [Sediminibacterium soli]NCI47191.1 sugar phosphate isomerase/epimerase [Sediminibacterium soli]